MTPGGNGAAHGECLDEVDLAEFADGRSEAARRDAHIAHLATCARCRQQLASVVALLSDRDVAAELPSRHAIPVAGARRGGWLLAVPVVAAAAIVAIVAPRYETLFKGPPAHRESPSASEPAPTLIAPRGDVSDARALRWSALTGADLYRVTLYNASGRVLYEADIRNTTVSLPDSVVIAPGVSYLWKVEARTGVGRWASSEKLTEFRLTPGRAP